MCSRRCKHNTRVFIRVRRRIFLHDKIYYGYFVRAGIYIHHITRITFKVITHTPIEAHFFRKGQSCIVFGRPGTPGAWIPRWHYGKMVTARVASITNKRSSAAMLCCARKKVRAKAIILRKIIKLKLSLLYYYTKILSYRSITINVVLWTNEIVNQYSLGDRYLHRATY